MGISISGKGGNKGISRSSIRQYLGRVVFLSLISCALLSARAGAQNRQIHPEPLDMKVYPSPYYIVHSDLKEDQTVEAVLRMTRMAEEYHERTKAFSGVIRTKLPFYLFKNEEDYYAAGAVPGSAGVFMTDGTDSRLMAIGAQRNESMTWHIVQHEGFHQFAHAVIGGELPPWLNEGLAEYFGEGLYTGDGFVTGLLPPARVREVQAALTNKGFPSLQNMMMMTQQGWNGRLMYRNYSMAWSMVHFLAHGDNGKYQAPFAEFVNDIGRQKNWEKAWLARFGSVEGFEKKWSDWWLALDAETATKDLYLQADLQMLTSILGRAEMQKQTFDNWNEFIDDVKAGTVKIPKNDDWLPPSLLANAAELVQKADPAIKFEIGHDPKTPQIIAVMPDGSKWVTLFNTRLKSGPGRVTITLDDLAVQMEKVKELVEQGKKPEARMKLLEAMKRNARSPLIPQAQKLQREIAK